MLKKKEEITHIDKTVHNSEINAPEKKRVTVRTTFSNTNSFTIYEPLTFSGKENKMDRSRKVEKLAKDLRISI